MKFAHLADCHLGGWRYPELQELNFLSFQNALSICVKENVDFILIAGDLFDSAYPPIDTIKETFHEFRKLKEAKIPVFLIAGSHDYSVSGKSFLDVLEKAGFAVNISKFEPYNDSIMLLPTIYKNIALYGYPGKKSGLEVHDIKKIKIHDSPGLFKILALHTTLTDAIGTLPIPSVNYQDLPKVDYLALGHLHLKYEKQNPSRVYAGPTFPNNASELEILNHGCFYIIDTKGEIKRQELKLKEVIVLDIEITDALTATEKLIEKLKNQEIRNKIVILKLKGVLERGKVSDINFNKIQSYLQEEGVYFFLKNTTKLLAPIADLEVEIKSDNLEEEIISKFAEKNPHKFNKLIGLLVSALEVEKKEDETSRVFEDRLFSEAKKIISAE
ncbi:MAG: DNA repair exonuclease [Candidatus Pacearchaeota archaeon]|nr:DNA repair exonuclease [Candidatus Pacearchaeota archaeon]